MSSPLKRRHFLQAGAMLPLAGAVGGYGADMPARPRIGFIGVGGRGTYLLQLALQQDIDVPAICDIDGEHLRRGLSVVAAAHIGRKPEGFGRGPTDYRRMLTRDDLDGVIIATPMQLHATMAVDSMNAGKHVLSEVAAAVKVDECWALVRTARKSHKIYMLAENCCYWPHVTTIQNMVSKGVFGEPTYVECGYVHDCRSLLFDSSGKLTWRGEIARDWAGNWYPTHSLGPVAQWIHINRGDRLQTLVATQTRSRGLDHYVAKRFPMGHPARKIKFKTGDSTNVLIQTKNGVVIDLRFDVCSARPHPSTTYHALQGTRGSYDSRIDGIWLEGRSPALAWQPLDTYAKEFTAESWQKFGQQAAGSGHGGADFFVMHEFLRCVRTGTQPAIDVVDAASWSCIMPLSAESIAAGSKPVPIPDFAQA